MIVNTAYIYMAVGGGGGGGGGGGDTPVNPNLWQDGVANYPVVFTNSSISADGLLLEPKMSMKATATFSELQLTDFANLEISGNNSNFVNLDIKFEFFDSSDQLLGTRTATFPLNTNTRTVTVPSKARIKNAKIKITNTATRYSITLISAVLS